MKTKNIFSLLLLPMALLLSCSDTECSEQDEICEFNLTFSVDMSQSRVKVFTEKDTMGMTLRCGGIVAECKNIPCVYNPAEDRWTTTKVLRVHNTKYTYAVECRYPYSATNIYPSCYDKKPNFASLDALYFGRSTDISIPLHGVSKELSVVMRHAYSIINIKFVPEDGIDWSLFDVRYIYNDGKISYAKCVSEGLFTMYINNSDGEFRIYYDDPTTSTTDDSYYTFTWSQMSIQQPGVGQVCNIEISDLLFCLNNGFFEPTILN